MKNYLLPFFIIFINSFFSQALNGSYTIGGVNPNYTTLNAAAIDLNLNGISGPVVFNIRPGIYIESFKIENLTGSSLINTVTFQSENLDSTSVKIEHYGTVQIPDIINIEFSSHINIKNVTISRLGQSRGIKVWNYSTHNHFSNCVFEGDFSNSNKTAILIDGAHLDSNSIKHNRFVNSEIKFIGGSSGNRASGLTIQDNTFEGGARDLIHLKYVENLTIENNIINGYIINPLTLSYCGENINVNNNKLHNYGYLASGISIQNSFGTINKPIKLFNNFISSPSGCLHLQYSSFVEVIHNNFNAFQPNYSTVIILGTYLTNNIFYNNIYNCKDEGNIYFSNTTSLDTVNFHSNHNLFYTSNKQSTSTFNSTTYSFNQWQQQSGQDLNSFFSSPNYINDSTDLHINNNTTINDQGTPSFSTTYDIDGDIRATNQFPDIGADEFDVDYSTFSDLELKKVVAPDTNLCNNMDSLIIQINNNSIFSIDSFYVATSLFGNILDSALYPITIDQNDSTIISLRHFNFAPNTLYDLEFEVIYDQDNYIENNKKEISFYNLENVEILNNNFQPCNSSTELYIKQTYPTSILWSTGETSSKIFPPQGTTTYFITVTNNNCSVSDTITIN